MLKDTKDRFGWISISLHWINAAFILALLYFGLQIAFGVDQRPRPAAFGGWRMWHESLGTIAIPFMLTRIFWRVRSGKPKTHDQHPLLKLAADTVWKLLLVCIVLQVVTGPLWRWWRGGDLEVFHYFSIPTPFPLEDVAEPPAQAMRRPAGVAPAGPEQAGVPEAGAHAAAPAAPGEPRISDERTRRHAGLFNKSLQYTHLTVGWIVFGLLILHVGGALKHLIVDRDTVLARMIWPGRRPRTTTSLPPARPEAAADAAGPL